MARVRSDKPARRGTGERRTITGGVGHIRFPAYLNQILSLGLGHERLQLRCRERVDKARLGYDQK